MASQEKIYKVSVRLTWEDYERLVRLKLVMGDKVKLTNEDVIRALLRYDGAPDIVKSMAPQVLKRTEGQ